MRGHLIHGNPAGVFPALGFAARCRQICKSKMLRLLGIPPKLILFFIYLSVYLSFYLSIFLFIYLSIYLSFLFIYLSIYLSFFSSVSLSFYLFISCSVSISIFRSSPSYHRPLLPSPSSPPSRNNNRKLNMWGFLFLPLCDLLRRS